MSTKEVQGKLWSMAPQDWSNYFEPFFSPMYRTVLNQLNLSESVSLLDAGCGAGFFCSMATKAGAHVTGIDAAPGLLEVARNRNANSVFLEADLEDLPFGNEAFDVVTGFNSFQYAGSFENALLQAKSVLKSGGRLVIGLWDKPENSDATNVLKAIGALLPPPSPGTPGPFALSEDGKVENILLKMDMKLKYIGKVPCPFIYHNVTEGVKSFMATGPAAAAVNHTRNKILVEDTIAGALQPFRVTEDTYFLQNHFLVFVAEK